MSLLPGDAEGGDLVDEVDVPHEHAPAAVTLEADFVQRLPGILAFVHGTICSSDPGPDHRVTIVFGASVISAVKVYVCFAPSS